MELVGEDLGGAGGVGSECFVGGGVESAFYGGVLTVGVVLGESMSREDGWREDRVASVVAGRKVQIEGFYERILEREDFGRDL